MELRYVEVKNWDNNDIIFFNLPERQITYRIVMCDGVYCYNRESSRNSKIFDYFGLNAKDFVQNIVGYPCEGVWPKVKSIDDFKKVIKALDDECIKKFVKPNTSKFKVGDMDINQAKDGDYLSITNNIGTKYIVLFRNINGISVTRYATYNSNANVLYFNAQKNYGCWGYLSGISKVNYATEEEKRLLDSKLLEEGYRWNSFTKKLEAIDSSTSINMDKPETQFEAELNLFPTKKHYQLNFNY